MHGLTGGMVRLNQGNACQVRPAVSDGALLGRCHNQDHLMMAAKPSVGARAQPGTSICSSAGPQALPGSSAGLSSGCGTQLKPDPQARGNGLPRLLTFFLTAKGWLSGSSSLSMSILVTMSLQQQCRDPSQSGSWEVCAGRRQSAACSYTAVTKTPVQQLK